jgi:short-subunit dehydrogenase
VILPEARVLVTGGSSGIGAAAVAAFAARGCSVVALGRDRAALADVARRTGATPHVADLTDPGVLDTLAADVGPIDVLVASAGLGWAGDLPDMSAETIDELVRVNVLAPMRVTHALLPGMVRRRRGRLVFVSSIAGHMAVDREAVYSATKAAVTVFAASVRHEVARHGVGVSVVSPGVVDTPFLARRGLAYTRRFPRPVSATAVAEAILRAVEKDHAEVFVPRWLRFPARLRGAAPRLTDALQRRFG